jgi:hypothetical protein
MSESGNAINVLNLKKCRDIAVAWGVTKYTPSHPDLAVTAMGTLITSAEASLDGVQADLAPWRTATTAADDAFSGLSDVARRVERAAKACGLAPSFLEDLAIPARKVKGQRTTPVAGPGGGGGTPPTGPGTGSASQMSRQQRIEHFDEMVGLLAAQTGYIPNEPDLKVVTLQVQSANLQSLVDDISANAAPLGESRNQRDQVLYTDDTNVVNTGRLFKAYVQSAYGLKSPEWDQVKGLQFRDKKD